jgi:transcriptional regulator with XRE-family HTH domain
MTINKTKNEVADTEGYRRKIRGERIRRFRIWKELTQVELGKLIGAKSPSTTISLIERGLQSISVTQAERIAEVLEIDPLLILTGENFSDEEMDLLDKFISSLKGVRNKRIKQSDNILSSPVKSRDSNSALLPSNLIKKKIFR